MGPAGALKFGFQHAERRAAADQVRIFGAAEALAAGQQPDGFQQIGLALAVGAAQHIQRGVWRKLGPGDVAVVGDAQMLQQHHSPSAI